MKRSALVCFLIFISSRVLGSYQAVAEGHDETILQGLKFRSIGPAVMGGRIDDIAVMESQPWIFYVGTASGGLWKTTNNGTTWESLFDEQSTSSIGDVALAPTDPEIVWVGTGEPNNRQSSTFGDGVYKSMDGGRTWRHMGLRDTQNIGRIVTHPRKPNVAYVAALGHLWGANDERGVFRTTDGGESWEKVLYIDEDTGVVDLAMDSVNPQILYAASYQRRRAPWGFNGGGPGGGLHKTTNGGKTWTRLTRGLPQGNMGRIGIDVYRKDPRIVYALVEAQEGGLFRSEDRGDSWEQVNKLNPRPMYYSKLRVDPNDAKRLYVLGAPFYVSDDGGKTFQSNTDMTSVYDIGVHGDHHSLWVDPANSRHLILGGDGGLYFSWDAGKTWDKINNIPIAQFYAIGVDMQEPYFIYAGAQDTHSWGGPSATRNHIGILNGDWFQINFGDGMYQQVDPTDPNTIYTESQGGNIVRFNRRTGGRKVIRPHPSEGEESYRFHWTSPIRISPHKAETIYLGGNRLFISRDRGETWTATGELTRAEDRDELPIMGIVPDETTLSRHDGTSQWGTLTTIDESPLKPGLVWVGADDGSVQVTQDGGETWNNISGRFPDFDDHRASVSRVVASHASEGRAYVCFDRHRLDDFSPYIFTTDDSGETWRSISEDLPDIGWVNVVVEHQRNTNLLFAGTETGLFVSIDRGQKWLRMKGNFPTVPVDDLVIHPRDNDLVVGTHGRSIYILDDLSPLEQLTPEVLQSDLELFDVRPTYPFLPWKHESYGAQRQFVGENPPNGAIVTYLLGMDEEDGVGIDVFDDKDNHIRNLEGDARKGMNRVVWDMRVSSPEGVERARGPLVPPGTYRVRLNVGSHSRETQVEVQINPVAGIDSEELTERFNFLMESRRLVVELREAGQRTKKIVEQIAKFLEGPGKEAPEPVRKAAEDVLTETKLVQTQLVGPGGRSSFRHPSLQMQVGRLFSEIDGDAVRQGTFHGPTAVQNARLVTLKQKADVELERLEQLTGTTVPELNRQIEAAKLPWIRIQ